MQCDIAVTLKLYDMLLEIRTAANVFIYSLI